MDPAFRSAGRLTGLLLALLCASGLLGCSDLTTQPAANATPVTRLQARPRALDSLMGKAHEAPSDHVMQMELEFALRKQAQLDQLMAEIRDPRSKRYQQW